MANHYALSDEVINDILATPVCQALLRDEFDFFDEMLRTSFGGLNQMSKNTMMLRLSRLLDTVGEDSRTELRRELLGRLKP